MENYNFICVDCPEKLTSLDIARVVGKAHNDVMKAIRKMEPAWIKVHGGNFSLMQRRIETHNGGHRTVPCYSLSRLETLFIATKFDDEARARLVIHCHKLEQMEKTRMLEVMERQHHQLQKNQSDAEYCREVLHSKGFLTTTEIGKEMGVSGRKANEILHEAGIQFRQGDKWFLYAPYQDKGYIDYETRTYIRKNGKKYTKRIPRWTEFGHRLAAETIGSHQRRLPKKPRYVEMTIMFNFE